MLREQQSKACRQKSSPRNSWATGSAFRQYSVEFHEFRGSALRVANYLKFACTCVSLVIVTSHAGAIPEQDPVQLTKLRPGAGVAVSVTVVPCMNFAEQLPPQLICVDRTPAGSPVTVPLPPWPIDSVNIGVNVAVTFSASFTVTEQVG